jgi:predicted negative regulator of RcsB-dependent stress response
VFVDDYLNEKEQWEQVKEWLKENGAWILAGVLVGAAALGGWRLYQQRIERLAHEASDRYEQVLQALGGGDRSRAQTLVGELERDHAGSPYVDQAQLAEARADVEANELDRAVARLRSPPPRACSTCS